MPLLNKNSESKENNRSDVIMAPEVNSSHSEEGSVANEMKTPQQQVGLNSQFATPGSGNIN